MSRRQWISVPYLDALRPEPGWRTDFAVIATYSADLVAVVAALLALAGLDDERGSGSKVDFARTIDELRDRVRVVAQAGRVVTRNKTPKILGLLDRFVRVVPLDEAEGSWHPKVSLARQLTEDGDAVQWRLWIGSRNLSRDTSWDVGLALVGRVAGAGQALPGIVELGRRLLEHADLPVTKRKEIASELKALRWEMPAGCVVEDVWLLSEGGRGIPTSPDGVKKLIVVSPFMDVSVIRDLSKWGDASTRRVLLSTQTTLSKLHGRVAKPLHEYDEVLYLDSPDVDGFLGDGRQPDEVDSPDDEEPEQRGLHAKLIYAEHDGGQTLWLGSANATGRGWDGPNIEAVARLSVGSEIGAGLEAFIAEIGRTVDLDALPKYEEDKAELRLEEARRQVASRWEAVLRFNDESLTLEAEHSPHPDDQAIRLEIGLLGRLLQEWPRTGPSLLIGKVARADLTELIQCRLSLGDLSTSWIARAPMSPPLDEERDRLAMANYLDPRTFLLWIRSLLTTDQLSDGGGDWDSTPGKKATGSRLDGPEWWAPTLEEVLKAWSRDPVSVLEVDRKVQRYLDLIGTSNSEMGSERDWVVVEEFSQTWRTLRGQLVEGVQ